MSDAALQLELGYSARLDGSNVRWNNYTLKIIVRLNLFKTMSRQHHSTVLRHRCAANLVSCFYVKSVITRVRSFGAHVCIKLWTTNPPRDITSNYIELNKILWILRATRCNNEWEEKREKKRHNYRTWLFSMWTNIHTRRRRKKLKILIILFKCDVVATQFMQIVFYSCIWMHVLCKRVCIVGKCVSQVGRTASAHLFNFSSFSQCDK